MSERGYLDGVPLRLTSKFYPQARPQFKEVDIHIPVDALQDDYDFSLERSVIIEVKTWEENQRIEAERKAEEARLFAEAEAKRLEEEAQRAAEEAERLAAEEAERLLLEEHLLQERIIAEEQLKQERLIAEQLEQERLIAEEKLQQERLIAEEKLQQERLIAEEKLQLERLADEARKLAEAEEKARLSAETESESLTTIITTTCTEDTDHQVENLVEKDLQKKLNFKDKDEIKETSKTLENTPESNPGSAAETPTSHHETANVTEGSGSPSTLHQQSIQQQQSDANNSRASPAPTPTAPATSNYVPTAYGQGHPHHYGAVRSNRINFSDFESDTANPFDNVELTSINEMEMLASVLKNDSRIVPPPPGQNNVYKHYPPPRLDTSTAPNYGGGGGPPQQYNKGIQPNVTPNYPTTSNPLSHPTPIYPPHQQQQQQQWAPNNYYLPNYCPSAPDIANRSNAAASVGPAPQSSSAAPPPQPPHSSNSPSPSSNSTNNISAATPASSANSFNKYYFPLLTSMADSRSYRDRQQNHYPVNLNQNYNNPQQLHSNQMPAAGSNHTNPFLNSPVQQFPILGSLSQPPSHHFWPSAEGQRMTTQTYNNVTNHHPILNGPLGNDTVHKSNSSHLPSDAGSGTTSNGTQQTLR